MQPIVLPQLGEDVSEVVVSRWLKRIGDRVEQYEPLLEVITDKVNIDVSSDYAGVLTDILVEEGASVSPNTVIAHLELEGDNHD